LITAAGSALFQCFALFDDTTTTLDEFMQAVRASKRQSVLRA
jgi:hypothetical protein